MKRLERWSVVLSCLLIMSLGSLAGDESTHALTMPLGSYVQVPHHADFLSDEMTVQGWFLLDVADVQQALVCKTDVVGESFDGQWALLISPDNEPVFQLRTEDGTQTLVSHQALSAGEWFHLAGTYDGSFARLYLNGRLVAEVAHSGAIVDTTYPIIIGADGNGTPASPFTGSVDDVSVWSMGVDSEDLLDELNLTLLDDEWGLVSDWKFESGSGTTATDSMSGHDGMLTSFVDADGAWVESTAPVGTYTLTQLGGDDIAMDRGRGLPIDVTWNDGPGDAATVAVMHILQPVGNPTGLLSYYPDSYWEIWVTGDDGSLNADVSFDFGYLLGIHNEPQLQLYTRADCTEGWTTADQSAYTINYGGSTTDGVGSVTIEGLSGFSQFILTSSDAGNPLAATIVWDGSEGDFNWSTPGNWDLGRVPIASDDVDIPDNTPECRISSNDPEVDKLWVLGDLVLNSSSFTLNDYGFVGGTFTINNGTYTSDGNLDIFGEMTWNSGQIAGSQTITITDDGSLSLETGSYKQVRDTVTIINEGTLTWSGGTFYFYTADGNTITIENNSEFIMNASDYIRRPDGHHVGELDLVNNGSIIKRGSTTANMLHGWLDNHDEVRVEEGTLKLSADSTHNSSIVAWPGAEVELSVGTHELGAGTTLDGGGTISVTSSSYLCPRDAATGAILAQGTTLSIEGGYLAGNGLLTANGTIDWSGGYIGNRNVVPIESPMIDVSSTGALNLTGGSAKYFMVTPTINNSGTISWQDGTVGLVLDADYEVTINNLADGLFEITGDDLWYRQPGGWLGMTILNNAGTVRKTSSAGSTNFHRIELNNSGALEVQTGTLALNATATLGGTCTVDAGATLEFGTATDHQILDGMLLDGAGTYKLDNGKVRLMGTVTLANSATLYQAGSGSYLAGEGSLVVHGDYNKPTGYLGDIYELEAPTVTISSVGEMSLGGGGFMFTPTINNEGIIKWVSNDIVMLSHAGHVTTINNLPGGLFDISCDKNWKRQSGWNGDTVINNAGTLRKSGAAGTSGFYYAQLNHTGTLEVDSGTLYLYAKAYIGADATVAEDATLQFFYRDHEIADGVALKGDGTYYISGGTVSLLGDCTLGANATLRLGGGHLQGNGIMDTDGLFDWQGGYLGAGGQAVTIDVSSTGAMDLSTASTRYFQGSPTIVNDGTVTWYGGQVRMDMAEGDIMTFDNRATGLFDIKSSTTWARNNRGKTQFQNAGTFRKSATTGDTSFYDFQLDQAGTLQIQTGRVNLHDAATIQNHTDVSTDATLQFESAVHMVNAGVQLGGAGLYRLGSGNLRLLGVVSLPSGELELKGSGHLDGNGVLDLDGLLDWQSGYLGTNGQAITVGVSTTGAVDLSSASTRYFQGSPTIANEGTVTWYGGQVRMDMTDGDIMTFDNRASGLFDIKGSTSWSRNALGTTDFMNDGTFRKSADTGHTSFYYFELEHTGTLQVQTGRVSFHDSTSIEADTAVSTDATLEFESAVHTVADGVSLTGAGTHRVASGNLRLLGTATVPNGSTLELQSGHLDGNGMLDLNGTLDWQSGYLGTTGQTTTVNVSETGKIDLTTENWRYFQGNPTIDNRGTISWYGGPLVMNSELDDILTVENRASGLFDILCSNNWSRSGGGSTTFNNAGTLRKRTHTGTTNLYYFDLLHTGTLQVDTGTLLVTWGADIQANTAVAADATLEFSGDIHEIADGVNFTGAGTHRVTGTLRFNGTATVANSANLQLEGRLDGAGNLQVDGDLDWESGYLGRGGYSTTFQVGTTGTFDITTGNTRYLEGTCDLINQGTLTWADGNLELRHSTWTVDNQVGGLMLLTSDNTWRRGWGYNGSVDLRNAGTLRRTGGANTVNLSDNIELTNTGTIALESGTMLLYEGLTQTAGDLMLDGGDLSSSSWVTINGGTLSGDGTITGNVRVDGGTLACGASPGAITIDGNYTQGSSGTLYAELAGLTAGTQYDQLTVTGTATLDGTLEVDMIDAFDPQIGDAFDLLLCGTRVGAFATETLMAPPEGVWNVGYQDDKVRLVVRTAAPDTDPGKQLNFDGSTGRIEIADSDGLDIRDALTIEGWILPTSFGTNDRILAKHTATDVDPWMVYGLHLVHDNGSEYLRFVISIDGTGYTCTSTETIAGDKWSYVAGVYDGSTMKVYINGHLVGEEAVSGQVDVNDQPLVIGGNPHNELNHFQGPMDELRLWSTARDIDALRNNMHRTLEGTEEGLVAYWQFNEADGEVMVFDLVGDAHGTIVNMDPDYVRQDSVIPLATEPVRQTNQLRSSWFNQSDSLESPILLVSDPDVRPFDYTVFGHNNAGLTRNLTNLPVGVEWRLDRVWQFQHAAGLRFKLWFDVDDLDTGDGSTLRVLIDDDGDFSDATVFEGGIADGSSADVLGIAEAGGFVYPIQADIDGMYVTLAGTDATAPTVTTLSPAAGSTVGTDINIDITFNEKVAGVDTTDLVLSGPAAAGASVWTLADQGGNVWRFALSDLSAGDLQLDLAPDAGDIEDLGGNDLAPLSWTYDVCIPVAITQHPDSVDICEGESFTMTVTATGTGPVTYQWLLDEAPLDGANNPTYVIQSATIEHDGSAYACNVINACGEATSNPALVTVNQPPAITVHPVSASTCIGGTIALSVTATGTASLSYQWRQNGIAVTGATSPNLTFYPANLGHSGSYDCVVTNTCGTATSNTATVTVNQPVAITTQPLSQTVCAGDAITLTVVATGTAPVTYQWRKDTVSIEGETNATLAITDADTPDAGSYDCVVTNACGSETSNAATLAVGAPPVILTSPTSRTICEGPSYTFRVTATGSEPLAYQWYLDDVAIAGATSSAYRVESLQPEDSGVLTCEVSNSCGTALYDGFTLVVPVAPVITQQPVSVNASPGDTVTFTVAGSGTAPLTYAWFKDGVQMDEAGTTLMLVDVDQDDVAVYTVSCSNICGQVVSAEAKLQFGRDLPAAVFMVSARSVTRGKGVVDIHRERGWAVLSPETQRLRAVLAWRTRDGRLVYDEQDWSADPSCFGQVPPDDDAPRGFTYFVTATTDDPPCVRVLLGVDCFALPDSELRLPHYLWGFSETVGDTGSAASSWDAQQTVSLRYHRLRTAALNRDGVSPDDFLQERIGDYRARGYVALDAAPSVARVPELRPNNGQPDLVVYRSHSQLGGYGGESSIKGLVGGYLVIDRSTGNIVWIVHYRETNQVHIDTLAWPAACTWNFVDRSPPANHDRQVLMLIDSEGSSDSLDELTYFGAQGYVRSNVRLGVAGDRSDVAPLLSGHISLLVAKQMMVRGRVALRLDWRLTRRFRGDGSTLEEVVDELAPEHR